MQSQIPVMAPRPSQSSLPSSLSTPHLGLVPPTRHLAVSGSPTHLPTSPSSSGSTGGLPSFRSFRNLLSFGPSKGSSSNSAASAGPSRPSLGLRRPANGEHDMPAPAIPASRSQDSLPVLSIELSHHVDEPLIDHEELERRLCADSRTSPDASPLSSVSTLSSRMPASPTEYLGTYCMVSYAAAHSSSPLAPSPGIHGISELSTILEAETSGISKHLPDLDDTDVIFPSRASRSPNPSAKSLGKSALSVQDTSVLELSTSDLKDEVLAALSKSGPKDGWSNGAVIEDAADLPDDERYANMTFGLGTVDPDLAALLSPHQLKTEPTLLVATGAVSPPLRSPTLSESRASSKPSSPHARDFSQSSGRLTPGRRSSSLPRPTPPVSPSRTATLSKATSSKLPVHVAPSRLSRSASERPSISGERSVEPSPLRPAESTGRTSLQLPRRRQSPLLGDNTPPPRPTSPGAPEQESRRSPASRSAIPARLAPSSSVRGSARLYPSPQSSPGLDGTESVSSHSPSAISSSASRRLNGVRPSLDVVGDRPRLYARTRSSSLDEVVPYDAVAKRPADWLGPRTAKAFAAAGLLDGDRESAAPSSSRPGSRFGTSRSERDSRSHYAPSRAGFSDLGSSSSWGRRSESISRGSESALGTPLSESGFTPRTTFSASTAPTSISSSSMQRHLQDELNSLQEKHTLETGALLSALADSQRTTRVLREENAQLRDRLQYAEEQFAAAREELQRQQFALAFNPPSTSTLGRGSLYRLAGQSATEGPRRGYAPSRLQTLLRSSTDNLRLEDLRVEKPEEALKPEPMPTKRLSQDFAPYSSAHRRRGSGASSIFHAPPSNMTMLLHDDGPAPETASPHSPTITLGKPLPKPLYDANGSHGSHAPHYSVSSSTANISPTTACFSFVTGSPGSLRLQPEHEVLLGDMPTLDLHASEDVHEFYPQHGL